MATTLSPPFIPAMTHTTVTDFHFSDGDLTYSWQRCRPNGDSVVPSTRMEDPFVLVFIHCLGTHKETWLPTVERIFEIQAAAQRDGNAQSLATAVKEVWLLDLVNHGCSAIANEAALHKHPDISSVSRHSRMLRKLWQSGLTDSTKIVAVGHSAGACVTSMSTLGYSLQALPYTTVIAIEPAMLPRAAFATRYENFPQAMVLKEEAKTRKDVWASRAAAHEWFRRRLPWKRWHPRVLELFVEHGLRDLPSVTYPGLKKGVTLSCTRAQEALWLANHELGVESLERLRELCTVIPVHFIFGSECDVMYV
ncbi:hypothetical protein BV25DRAFT_319695 [Artomyces pyxidatus]|uniref:Uncharacterized protein n=1 Tax=Artomyces pyxidatus TaxID=48021 RepID=A0ACB8T8C6_9AGAM|nr:hypothetical protein BV25DRAFT_319695 [Artomyces pyxidatus]